MAIPVTDGPPVSQLHPSYGQFDEGPPRHHPYQGCCGVALEARGIMNTVGGEYYSYCGGRGLQKFSSSGGRGFEESGRHQPYRGGNGLLAFLVVTVDLGAPWSGMELVVLLLMASIFLLEVGINGVKEDE